MTAYRAYANSQPYGSTRNRRMEQQRRQAEAEANERTALVRRADTMKAVAQVIAEQNEKMLAGLRGLAQQDTARRATPLQVDFVARNISQVGPSRSTISAKEQRLMARAEVMAAATAHLDGAVPPARAQRPRRATTRRSCRAGASRATQRTACYWRSADERVRKAMTHAKAYTHTHTHTPDARR